MKEKNILEKLKNDLENKLIRNSNILYYDQDEIDSFLDSINKRPQAKTKTIGSSVVGGIGFGIFKIGGTKTKAHTIDVSNKEKLFDMLIDNHILYGLKNIKTKIGMFEEEQNRTKKKFDLINPANNKEEKEILNETFFLSYLTEKNEITELYTKEKFRSDLLKDIFTNRKRSFSEMELKNDCLIIFGRNENVKDHNNNGKNGVGKSITKYPIVIVQLN